MAGDTIAIWWIDLDAAAADEAVLSAEERARAARRRLPVERRRFVAGRAALRHLLGVGLGRAPAALRLVEGPHGKPALADAPLAFNLAHRGGMALLALGGERALGVDCEAMADDGAAMRAAIDPFLSPAEHRLLGDGADAALLYRLWTRKEAVAKAAGLGVGFPFAAATLLPEGVEEVAVPGQGTFRLQGLSAPAGFAATLCGAGPAPLTVAPPRGYPLSVA